MVSAADVPIEAVAWSKAHRIIRSIYPPIDLFEDIADPADWELIASAEAKTNPRVRDEIGAIHAVPVARRVGGAGASAVMAPFVHFSRERPSRFSDGSYGVYYAGDRFEVALYETVYHFEAFMRRTQEPPTQSDFRELVGTVDARLHSLCGAGWTAALDPTSYGASQPLGRALRAEGSSGIVYPSVRFPTGFAVALFWPDVPAIPVQGRHLLYHWDGGRADRYLVYGESHWRPL